MEEQNDFFFLSKKKSHDNKMVKKEIGKKTPYGVRKLFAEHSPMKTAKNVRLYLQKYKKNKGSVGFTITASLKSMGLIPRSNGMYVLGKKYQLLQKK